MGIALSDSSSTKSLTMKSLFEKFSRVKLGPFGYSDLAEPLLREAIFDVHEVRMQCLDMTMHRSLTRRG